MHVALGRSIGGFPAQQRQVIFFSGEDGGAVLQRRLRKICRAYGIDPADLEGNLHLIDGSEIDPTLYKADARNGKRETALLDALAEQVATLDAGLVVIDNASDVFDGEEIKRSHVRGFIRALRTRIARPGRAVMLLAHINKASASGAAIGREDYSGSTAWHNSVRSRLSLLSAGQNTVTVEHQKANLGSKASPLRFEWVAGVPIVQGALPSIEAAAAAHNQREADKSAIVEIIRGFDTRGERVTTSMHGSFTLYRLLKSATGFPKGIDSDRLNQLVRELETEGQIFRRTVRTPDRKTREVFTCTESAPNAPDCNVGQGGGQK